MHQLVRENINMRDEAYSNIRVEEVSSFSFVKYIVVIIRETFIEP